MCRFIHLCDGRQVSDSDFEGLVRKFMLSYRRDDSFANGAEHLSRYIETLRLIGKIDPRPNDVCDLATYGNINPVMQQFFGIENIVTTGCVDPQSKDELVFCDSDGLPQFRYPYYRFDLEGPFPFADDSFDMVVFTEVLEHLSIDPMHTMAEINRITRMGGWLILTTPNCASLQSIFRLLRGEHPYMWAPYSRRGDRDRHNREYTPDEVQRVITASGFEVRQFYCKTVIGPKTTATRRLAKKAISSGLAFIRRASGNRMQGGRNGETIFAVAKKTSIVLQRHPEFLYF